ncbi:MAG: hypothetical protein GXP61_11510 [Epsilonproteobacteria bacterium]|nr:hypothetical protein [Campylobacterota bacterium]
MQIVLFLLLVLAVLVIFVSKKNSVSKSVKIYMTISLVFIFLTGWLFTAYNQKNAQRDRDIINAFEQGKILTCQEYKVNNSDFIFVSGTLSFVAKQSAKNLKGVVIDISTCSK